jgi:hypothetical protein
MPVRLTPEGAILVSWDSSSRQWVYLHSKELGPMLSHLVDIQPGTTLANLFDMVENDQQVKAFLATYCECDISALHALSRRIDIPILVPSFVLDEAGHPKYSGRNNVADTLAVTSEVSLRFTEKEELSFSSHLDATIRSSKEPQTGLPLRKDFSLRDHGALCSLELSLDNSVEVVVEETVDGSAERTHPKAVRRYTLLELLATIYESFGTRDFDQRSQDEVDFDEEFVARLRQGSDDLANRPPDSTDKGSETDDPTRQRS